MSIHPNGKAWQRSQETGYIRGQESDLTLSSLVEKYAVQAERFAQAKENANLVKVFISSGKLEEISNARNKKSAASFIVRNDPHFIPSTIEGIDHQTAFILALADELQKPNYNQ